jgi:general secretion pathway protein I
MKTHKPVPGVEMPRKSSGDSGFTLLEVMIAVAVLSIAMVAILYSNMQVQDSLIHGRRQTELSLAANNILADVLAEGIKNRRDYHGELEKNPQYSWSLEVRPTQNRDLSLIIISISDRDNLSQVFQTSQYMLN